MGRLVAVAFGFCVFLIMATSREGYIDRVENEHDDWKKVPIVSIEAREGNETNIARPLERI